MKTWQIVLLVLGCVFGGILLLVGIPALIATKNVNSIMNDAREEAKQRSALLVIQEVEYAYNMALFENSGEYPTLEQVKSYFELNNATWTSDYVIETEGFNCDIEVVNNNLKVICLETETSTNMILSN